MRRALIVLVTFLLLGAAIVVVIRLRVTGAIVLPQEAATAQDAAPVAWPSVESETTPAPLPPPPPPADDGSTTPDAPPEGWVWWGRIAFREEAKIQSNSVDDRGWGYEVPVQYTNDGTLIVASKYRDHSACIWSYDVASGKFAVLHRKTRQAVDRFTIYGAISQFRWMEQAREYTWEPSKENGRVYRNDKGRKGGTLRGGALGDQCYDAAGMKFEETGGLIFRRSTLSGMPVPLNHGALELYHPLSIPYTAIPFTNAIFPEYRKCISMMVYNPVSKSVESSIPTDAVGGENGHWDFGKGLFLNFYCSKEQGPKPQRVALLTYPDLRVIARGDLPESGVRLMQSAKDGLALDVIADNFWANVAGGQPVPGKTVAIPSQKLFRVRVPDDWRKARGRRDMACIWEDPAKDLAALEVTELGAFDVGKYDAHWFSEVKDDPVPKNLTPSYVYRDGVMYWRKRHTGEVVMASVDNLDAQTVIGGEGATWDGFRVNPARDEVVTWRENGELVFWNIQFPAAEPLYKARVITDETPHRLEAM
jgi:hypothetical protein